MYKRQGFIRYGRKLNFFKKFKGEIIFPVGGSVEVFMGLGFLNNPGGIWFGSPYWYESYSSTANRDFVAGYVNFIRSRTIKVYPSYAAYMPYAAIMMYKKAVEEAGTTNKESVVSAMEGLSIDNLPVGKTTFRKSDHQAIFNVSFGRTGGPAQGSHSFRGLKDIKLFLLE